MNYIKHLTGFFDKLVQDDRLNPTHISLYLALFQFWNIQRFKNPISISREEVMRLSKISSKATYHKCMRELDAYQFIDYDPSYNPYRGSLITLHNLELTHEQVQKSGRKNTKKQTGSEQVNSLHLRQVVEPLNEPSVNNIKQIETKEKLLNNVGVATHRGHSKKNEKKDVFLSPSLDEVKGFFRELQTPEMEAEKFFNHFESNGWLVGGKTKMKNWQAAARNWILNSKKFNDHILTKVDSGADRLHVSQEKDYSIPL